MKRIFLLLSLFVLFAVPVYSQDLELVNDYYDMAQTFYNQGNFEQAKEYSNQILKISPEHFGANYMIIRLTPPSSRFDKTKLLTKLIIRPTNPCTNFTTSDKYNLEGEKYYDTQSYDLARQSFLCAIKNNYANKYAYNNLGLTYWKLKKYKKAEYSFKRAYMTDKFFSTPLTNMSQMFIELNKYTTAKKYLNLAIKQNKNDYCAYYLLGILYNKENLYLDAAKNFEKVTQISPDFKLAYIQQAEDYYKIKEYNWSNAVIEKYISLEQNADIGYYILYRNYMALDDYNVAKNYIIKAISINNCVEYRIALADVEYRLNDIKSAIESLKIINNPSANILNKIGQYYLEIKDCNNALKYFELASKSKQTRPIYLYNVAMVYKNNGDLENYKKQMSVIESLNPMITQDYIDLSAIFLDYYGKNKAIDILNKGIKLSSKNRALYDAKLNIYKVTNDKGGIDKTQKEINRTFNKWYENIKEKKLFCKN